MRRARVSYAKAAVVLSAATAALMPAAPNLIERWFSASIYPVLQRQLTPLTNALPFALLDVLAVAAAVGATAVVARGIRTARRRRRWVPLGHSVATLATAAAVAYLTFLLLWGLNYRRVPMAERIVIGSDPITSQQALELGIEAARQLTAMHSEAHRTGWDTPPWQDAALVAAFGRVQQLLIGTPVIAPGRFKPTMFGPYFRWTSVDGMINPFGLEVLANPDLLPFERPFVAAHEWAHLAGFAQESEASFVGWLACLQGEVPAQYSGWLFVYWQAAAEVDRAGRAQIVESLGDGPRRDLEAIAQRVSRGQLPWLRAAGWEVYDQYLKANRVEEGVRSYGEVLTLILRARYDAGWMPVRRDVGS